VTFGFVGSHSGTLPAALRFGIRAARIIDVFECSHGGFSVGLGCVTSTDSAGLLPLCAVAFHFGGPTAGRCCLSHIAIASRTHWTSSGRPSSVACAREHCCFHDATYGAGGSTAALLDLCTEPFPADARAQEGVMLALSAQCRRRCRWPSAKRQERVVMMALRSSAFEHGPQKH
jgi:hypothetical protein